MSSPRRATELIDPGNLLSKAPIIGPWSYQTRWGVERFAGEHGLWATTKTLPDGRTIKLPFIRLSDTEIITKALDSAASALREDDAQAAKQGLVS